jgi:iron-sulfur cluster repair protein YtfE (RIC family)
MPLLRDYIAEHERVVNLGGDAVRAMRDGDLDRARSLVADMAEELASHWRGEEDGLFAAMERDELYAEHIAPLVREHRELAALLQSVDLADPADRDRVVRAVDDLHLHIAKEEDGLFPASLTALGGQEWDAAMAAWQRAHPHRHLIGDAHHRIVAEAWDRPNPPPGDAGAQPAASPLT